MSLTGIIKISTSAFLFSRSAAEVDVKKLPTSAAHTAKSDEFCAVLRWHTGDGSQNAPAGTSLRGLHNFWASFGACGFQPYWLHYRQTDSTAFLFFLPMWMSLP